MFYWHVSCMFKSFVCCAIYYFFSYILGNNCRLYIILKGENLFLWLLIHQLERQLLQNMHLLWHQKYEVSFGLMVFFFFFLNTSFNWVAECRTLIFSDLLNVETLLYVLEYPYSSTCYFWVTVIFYAQLFYLILMPCSTAQELYILHLLKPSAIRNIGISVGNLMLDFSLVMLAWGQRLLVSSWPLKYWGQCFTGVRILYVTLNG